MEIYKRKKEEENLINCIVQIGSGEYMAPELLDEIFEEYDSKIDVYSLGIIFCSLAFYQTKLPDINELSKSVYSNELLNIIKKMIEKNPSKRPSSLEIYNIFMKFYVDKYFHLTSLKSCIYSLFISPSIFNYLCQLNIEFEKKNRHIPFIEKIYEIFKEKKYVCNININNEMECNNKKENNINQLFYELKELLLKKGMKMNEIYDSEINPFIILTFLLKNLHEELNIYKEQAEINNTN